MKVKQHKSLFASIALCTLLYACKEKYLPDFNNNGINYLVVEGFINTGADSTIFTLSRTFENSGKPVIAFEKGALISVESETGLSYTLPGLSKAGNYGRPSLNLDATKKHRLRIRTRDNKEYLSDFVESKTSPPIDEIKYDFKNDHMNIYVDSHDPSGKSRYYNYSYVETWEYASQLRSLFKVENQKILGRNFPEENIFNCWHNVPSSNIVLASTNNLTEDRISDVRLISIPNTSLKIDIEYSILVKQMVLTKQGFDFLEILKKNTEDVGSIFDSQPSQLFGNIKSTTNSAEMVIGFISAGTVTQKRIILTSVDLPRTIHSIDSSCIFGVKRLQFASSTGNQVQQFLTGPIKTEYIPLEEIRSPSLSGYTATNEVTCVDCRTQGGTNKRPSYWK